MKKIIKFSIFSLLFLVLTSSCKDDDKILDVPPLGAIVTIIPQNRVIDYGDLTNSAYTAIMDNPGNNVDTFTISAQIEKSDGSTTNNAVIEVLSEFPTNISFTGNFILEKLGLTSTDVNPGDIIKFSGVALTDDGRTFNADDLNGDASGDGLLAAFEFEAPFFCEFVVADAVGEYTATVGNWFGAPFSDEIPTYAVPDVVMAVAGDQPNTIVFKDLITPGYDLTVTVDPTTAIAVVDNSSIAPGIAGYTGGFLSTSGTAFYFSCTGNFTANYQVCVDIGCFGATVPITLQKN